MKAPVSKMIGAFVICAAKGYIYFLLSFIACKKY
jgi:hypothetical protein